MSLEQRVGKLLRRKKALWDYTVPVAEVVALVEADVRERVARDLLAEGRALDTGAISVSHAVEVARNGAST